MIRQCTTCGKVAYTTPEAAALFTKTTRNTTGFIPTCKVCRNAYVQQSRGAKRVHSVQARQKKGTFKGKREQRIYYKYGLMFKDVFQLFVSQKGMCRICYCTPQDARNCGHTYFAIDHCHTTGKVRGLLCMSCNTGLGMFNDDPSLMQEIVDYLKQE